MRYKSYQTKLKNNFDTTDSITIIQRLFIAQLTLNTSNVSLSNHSINESNKNWNFWITVELIDKYDNTTIHIN